MLDRDIATSMIADLDDLDGQMYPPDRVAQQFRYALAEMDLAHKRVAELDAAVARIDALATTLESQPADWPAIPRTAVAAELRNRMKGAPVDLGARHRLFVALRDELEKADVCLACGAHTPGRGCQCENDE
jgi:hypothetical protein